MKILLAIRSTNPELIADNALRWAARTGFELRIFAPRDDYHKYVNAVNDANYHWYLAVKHEQIITKYEPHEYAEMYGFDLILYVPEAVKTWRRGHFMKDDEIMLCAEAVGKARAEFGRKPRMRVKKWANGCIMVRV